MKKMYIFWASVLFVASVQPSVVYKPSSVSAKQTLPSAKRNTLGNQYLRQFGEPSKQKSDELASSPQPKTVPRRVQKKLTPLPISDSSFSITSLTPSLDSSGSSSDEPVTQVNRRVLPAIETDDDSDYFGAFTPSKIEQSITESPRRLSLDEATDDDYFGGDSTYVAKKFEPWRNEWSKLYQRLNNVPELFINSELKEAYLKTFSIIKDGFKNKEAYDLFMKQPDTLTVLKALPRMEAQVRLQKLYATTLDNLRNNFKKREVEFIKEQDDIHQKMRMAVYNDPEIKKLEQQLDEKTSRLKKIKNITTSRSRFGKSRLVESSDVFGEGDDVTSMSARSNQINVEIESLQQKIKDRTAEIEQSLKKIQDALDAQQRVYQREADMLAELQQKIPKILSSPDIVQTVYFAEKFKKAEAAIDTIMENASSKLAESLSAQVQDAVKQAYQDGQKDREQSEVTQREVAEVVQQPSKLQGVKDSVYAGAEKLKQGFSWLKSKLPTVDVDPNYQSPFADSDDSSDTRTVAQSIEPADDDRSYDVERDDEHEKDVQHEEEESNVENPDRFSRDYGV